MANKRQLKKFINDNCRELAFVTFIADCAVRNSDENKFTELLNEIENFRVSALDAASFSFDKTPSAFADRREYNRAKNAYFKKAYTKFHEDYAVRLQKIIDEINSIQPK